MFIWRINHKVLSRCRSAIRLDAQTMNPALSSQALLAAWTM